VGKTWSVLAFGGYSRHRVRQQAGSYSHIHSLGGGRGGRVVNVYLAHLAGARLQQNVCNRCSEGLYLSPLNDYGMFFWLCGLSGGSRWSHAPRRVRVAKKAVSPFLPGLGFPIPRVGGGEPSKHQSIISNHHLLVRQAAGLSSAAHVPCRLLASACLSHRLHSSLPQPAPQQTS
jgi:hypothetical protein